ncbi:MAG: spore germination protein, partial [Mycobacterium leprae]
MPMNLTQIKRFFIADLTTARDPFSLGRWETPIDDAESPETTAVQKLPAAFEGELRDVPLACSLDDNITAFKQQFKLPTSQGLIIHRVQVPLDPPVEAAVIYIAGMADTTHVSDFVLRPLQGEGGLTILPSTPKAMLHGLFPEGQSYVRTQFFEVVLDLMEGAVAVLVDGETDVATMRAEGWKKRNIDRAQTEVTVRGPSEAFVEDLRTNLSQVRRRLRTEEFMIELGCLGRLSRTDVALLYIKNITNERLVDEVRRRISGVDV